MKASLGRGGGKMLHWDKGACAIILLGAATAIAVRAQDTVAFTTLHSFDSKDGDDPFGTLIQATDGNLYGTTSFGFRNGGTVFKITPSGALTTLYGFCHQSRCTDGDVPLAGLVQAIDGNFYGTTTNGGANGHGTVFQITATRKFTELYSFCSQAACADGSDPGAGLVQATDGNFYGTAEGGGANDGGTVFKITPEGTLTTLYSFCSQSGCADGGGPDAGLVQAADGNFYGTTMEGGVNDSCFGVSCGTVFKITRSGALTTLYSFCSASDCSDGEFPQAALVQATDGSLYGTTTLGGANGEGTVFKITPDGTLTTLYSFCSRSGCADGSGPRAALIQATDGDLYGTTNLGGANGGGTVFKITLSGMLMTLYTFCSKTGCTDGEGPFAGLVQDTSGKFYGTTGGGGTGGCPGGGCGTVFSLSAGLGPFVETQPVSGTVGVAVNILGTNLTGATAVTFNGTATVFTVVSPTLIATNVPSGATTGKVQVVTPHGTLSSNLPFRVLP
jgi:uncharacterized repeat protein (TIGR03803 family)